MEYLYHYTNVETLALILSKRTIRFNALNQVDDLQEQETADVKNLGRFCFVSCWTEDEEESIPMWKMYGKLESGIRIKTQKYPFKEMENSKELFMKYNIQSDNVAEDGCIKSLITLDDYVEKKIASTGLVQQKDILFKVEYTQDKSKLYPQIIFQDGEKVNLALGELGKYKNTGWEFQKEWRYRLIIYPFDIIADNNMEAIEKRVNSLIQGKAFLPFSYYDLQINDNAFENMEIMLSPKISEGNKIIVQNLVNNYNPKAIVLKSEYTGYIK